MGGSFRQMRCQHQDTKAQPWTPHEFLTVDGVPHVYTVSPGTEAECCAIDVRLPGGRSVSIEKLRAAGHVVLLPKMLRAEPPKGPQKLRGRRPQS